jgi:DNA primase
MSLYLVDIFESFLGDIRKHNEDTGQIAFDCPACSAEKGLVNGDGKGNLELNYEKGVFNCWVCHDTNHMHGPLSKLIKKYGSKKNLADYILLKPDEFKEREHKKVVVKLPEGYKKLSECTSKDYKSEIAKAYLKARGITDDIIKEFDIGYTIKGDFQNRVVIPSYDSDNNLNYFVARWFDKKFTRLKYLNPQVEKQEMVFNEGKVNWDATIYLVEGTTDHIVTPNSIPLLGKYVSDILFELLQEKAKSYVVIVLDDDAYEDAKNLYHKLNTYNLEGMVKIVRPPEGYDPSKIYERLGRGGIIKLLQSAQKLKD